MSTSTARSTSDALVAFMSNNIRKAQDGTKGFVGSLTEFASSYSQGLFGLVMGLIALGLEFILDDTAFKCPRTNYKLYAITFFVAPTVLLFMLNLLTFPAMGNYHVWTFCESCLVKAYRRTGDVVCRLFSALLVGCVAPMVWIIVALFNTRYLLCWELGFNLNDNVTSSYITERGFSDRNVTRYELKVDHAKVKSRVCGAIALGVSVLFLGFFLILRRSFRKPYEVEDQFPALWQLEKSEALAASAELKRLLFYGSNLKEVPFAVKQLVVRDQIRALENELEQLPKEDAEEQKTEIEFEIKEYKELMKKWNTFIKRKCGESQNMAESDIEKAKTEFLDARDAVGNARKERMKEAEKKLEEIRKALSGEADEEEMTKNVKILEQNYWLINKLRGQNRHLEFDACPSLDWLTDDEKTDLRAQLVMALDEDNADSREAQGCRVARRILKSARANPNGPHENAIQLFEWVYPRAGTGSPRQRYINVDAEPHNSKVTWKRVPGTTDEWMKVFGDDVDSREPAGGAAGGPAGGAAGGRAGGVAGGPAGGAAGGPAGGAAGGRAGGAAGGRAGRNGYMGIDDQGSINMDEADTSSNP